MNYLFVGAHLDDIELAAGGTIAKLKNAGHTVSMLVLSQSDYTDVNGKTLRNVDIALSEGYEAARILGCDLEVLDYPTKDIPYNSNVVSDIERVINRKNIDAVFTHNIHDTHQAHINTAYSTISAARYLNTIYFYEPIYPSGRAPEPFNPQVYVDITDFIDIKLESLKAHKSQYEKYKDEWIEAVKARAIMRGFDSRFKYAECFELCRMEMVI